MIKVWIAWGNDRDTQKETVTCYEFKTRIELEAFMKGVEEASGWMDYTQLNNKKELKEFLEND